MPRTADGGARPSTLPQDHSQPRPRWDAWVIGSLLVGAVFWSFVASSGPIQWMDNGWLLFVASQGSYFPQKLYATIHPLYQTATVFLFDLFGPPAVAYLNSVLMVPLAYLVYRLSGSLGADRPYAALAALAVLLLQNVFWVSTKMEVYGLHLLTVLAAYWIVFDERAALGRSTQVLLVGLLTGLGAATHQLTFIVLFPLYLFMTARAGGRILWAVPGFLIGMFPCYPALFNQFMSGSDPWTLLRVFMTGSDGSAVSGWEGALFRFDRMWADKAYVSLVLLSLCGIGLLGLLRPPPGSKSNILWWAATLNLMFAVSYALNDRFTFFLPGAVFYTLLGVAWVSRRYPGHRVAVYATLAAILAHPAIMVGTAALAHAGVVTLPGRSATLPYRDDVTYFMAPYIPDRSAEAFVRAYERQVPAGSVVASDFTAWAALRSAQVTGRFLGRTLVQCDEERPAWPATMYLVRKYYCEDYLKGYRIEPAPVGWIAHKF
jgi:4-amino-4-deoxy-L-arabinose transferase-like glycosyltransferase